jgi:ABC-type multidrug transport system ATPase subunit
MNVIEASGLGKRYGRTWALRECTLAVPAGRVAALVGPNGAGKTTLLNLAVGLAGPSARAAGCSRCRCCSSRRPSGWSAAVPPEPLT